LSQCSISLCGGFEECSIKAAFVRGTAGKSIFLIDTMRKSVTSHSSEYSFFRVKKYGTGGVVEPDATPSMLGLKDGDAIDVGTN
jgi:hypothetical protein